MMNAMMQETLETGTARKAAIRGWPAAGKTGTSQDSRDAWFIGYTANLITGVWFGNDDNSPTKKVTGGGLPVEVWTRFMRAAHQGVPVASLPNSQRGGFMSNLFQTASQVSAAPSRRRQSRRAADIGRRRQEPRRRHPIHRRARKRRRDWMAGWWTGCSDGSRTSSPDGAKRNPGTVQARLTSLTGSRCTCRTRIGGPQAASWQRRPAFPPKRAGTNPRRRRSRAGCIRTRPDGRWSWASWCRE